MIGLRRGGVGCVGEGIGDDSGVVSGREWETRRWK